MPTDLIVRSESPFNAEPRPDALIGAFLTPQHSFYVRSHGDVPRLDAGHAVVLDGLGTRARSFTVADLRRTFPEREAVATLQCAGNRRADLQQVAPTSGDPWDVGAIGNARWTGVRLADVLDTAGAPDDPSLFVAFTSADEVEVDGAAAPYGVSIGMTKAREPDVLLAWAMNGEPLLPEHGAPLRLVVPGYAGVRSAKWLTRIEVQAHPSDAPIQARDYKLFPASVAKEDADWNAGLTIEAMPLNAAICEPADGDSLAEGELTLRGYAVAYGRAVSRVEVSLNGGRDWKQARSEQDGAHPHAWTRWSLAASLPKGRHELVVRAFDAAGQAQPEQPDAVWNFAGYLCTAWHRVRVLVR